MTSDPVITAEASVTSKNLSRVAVLRVAQYPFMALFALVVPRLMGPDDYGRYAWFVSIVGIASSFLDLGMTEIATRSIPESQQRQDEYGIRRFFSRMLAFKLVLDVPLGLAFLLGALLFRVSSGTWQFVWPFALTLLIGDVGATAYALLFGLNKLAICSARDPIRRAAGLIAVVGLYHFFGMQGAIVSVVIVEAIVTVINFCWAERYLSLRELWPSWSFSAPLLRYGFLFYLSWGITNVWQRLGNTLIGYLRHDYGQIALFDLSNQIFLTATGFTMFLITALAPIFTQLRLQGKETKLIDWTRRILTYSQIACAAVLGGWLLIGSDVIPILIGRQYGGLYPNVAVLLCGTFLMVIVQLGLALAMAYAEPVWYLLALCVAVASFIIASCLLVPGLGALGCSVATLISCACCALTIGARYRRLLSQSFGPGLKAVMLGVCLLLPCWWLRGTWVRNELLLLCFLVAFGAALAVGGVLKSSEMREAWRALRHKGS
jgi:O-antigen/teichoic acid export membrane protein